MGYTWDKKCENCQTLVRISEVNVNMPYKSEETAECPVCGHTILKKNSRGDLETEVLSIEETIEPYKSRLKQR